jgi:hypothetical protein
VGSLMCLRAYIYDVAPKSFSSKPFRRTVWNTEKARERQFVGERHTFIHAYNKTHPSKKSWKIFGSYGEQHRLFFGRDSGMCFFV